MDLSGMKMTPLKFQETADPESLSLLGKINSGLASILQAIRSIRIDLPSIYKVEGNVTVDRISQVPPIVVSNLEEIRPYFEILDNGLTSLQNATVKSLQDLKTPENSGPELVKIADSVQIQDFSDLLDGIEELKKGFNLLLKKDFGGTTNKDGVSQVELVNFRQLIPQPVTSVSLNPLRGSVLTTAMTVGTSVTALPASSLANRRGILVYNNDSSTTLYIGGSAVTTSTGMPIPPLSYSPALDLGPNMIVYGIAGSSINIRVMELSNDGLGGSH